MVPPETPGHQIGGRPCRSRGRRFPVWFVWRNGEFRSCRRESVRILLYNPSVGMEAKTVVAAARRLAKDCATLSFGAPVTHVYHPLLYAWSVHPPVS